MCVRREGRANCRRIDETQNTKHDGKWKRKTTFAGNTHNSPKIVLLLLLFLFKPFTTGTCHTHTDTKTHTHKQAMHGARCRQHTSNLRIHTCIFS